MVSRLPPDLLTHAPQRQDQLPMLAGGLADQRPVRNPAAHPRVGLSMRFKVHVDELDLGGWSSCRGLNVQFGTKEIFQGGDYYRATLLPERIGFSTVTLERAMSRQDSPRLQQWLRQVAEGWTCHEYDDPKTSSYEGQNVVITLFDSHGDPVTSWALRNAFPKEWAGPDLSSGSNSVALEKLSFVHAGFLEH